MAPKSPKIGLLTPYDGGNLGDAAIQTAVIQNIQARCPAARLVGINLFPQRTGRMHRIPVIPLAGFDTKLFFQRRERYQGPELEGDEPEREAEQEHQGDSAANRPARPRLAREAVLAAAETIKPLVKAVPPVFNGLKWTARASSIVRSESMHLVEVVRELNEFDIIIMSGGGQFDDLWSGDWGHPYNMWKWAQLAQLRGVRFYIGSIGVNVPRTPLARTFFARTMALAGYRSFRDADSRRRAADFFAAAANDPLVPDFAFSLDVAALRNRPIERADGETIVGVSPIAYGQTETWPLKSPDVYERHVDEMTRFVRGLVDRGYRVVLFSSDSCDVPVVDTIAERVRREREALANRVEAPPMDGLDALLSAIQRVDLVVACRLHGVILSHVLHKPTVAISFDPKVDSHLELMGQSAYRLDIHDIRHEQIDEAFERLERNQQAERAVIQDKSVEYARPLSEQYDRLLTV